MYNNYILLSIKIVRKLLNVPIVVVLKCTYIYAKILEIMLRAIDFGYIKFMYYRVLKF